MSNIEMKDTQQTIEIQGETGVIYESEKIITEEGEYDNVLPNNGYTTQQGE